MLKMLAKAVTTATLSVWCSYSPAIAFTITYNGEHSVIYESLNNACHKVSIPDAPARAFRRENNQVALFASSDQNWILLGKDFNSLKPNCDIVLGNQIGSKFSRKGWIEATYTRNGLEVLALVTQDMSDLAVAEDCVAQQRGGCWLNQIVGAVSSNMGQSFTLTPPRLIAAPPSDTQADPRVRRGAFTTSNIASKDGMSYVLIYVESAAGRGHCLFRSKNPFGIRSWEVWDGRDFQIIGDTGDYSKCSYIGHGILDREVRSLLFVPSINKWIAIFAGEKVKYGDTEKSGAFYSSSSDLINWSDPTLILELPLIPRVESQVQFYSYPSLIDPASSSRNFDTIEGPLAYIYFTSQKLKDGSGTMNRNLERFTVHVSY